MTKQARTSRVLIALVAAMTVGALVLMALDGGSIGQGPFSLYAHIKNARILKTVDSQFRSWDRIEVFYSGTTSDDLDLLLTKSRPDGGKDANFHFVVRNPSNGQEETILYTQKWVNQLPCNITSRFNGTDRTLRICLVADGLVVSATDAQRQAVMDLVKTLSGNFSIIPPNIEWPSGW